MEKEFNLEILELIGVSAISLILGFILGYCSHSRRPLL